MIYYNQNSNDYYHHILLNYIYMNKNMIKTSNLKPIK